jgi:hypothetical protein
MVNQALIRFSVHVSVALYVVLLFAEYLRPGFVSTAMNVHVMWFVIAPLILLLNAPIAPNASLRKDGVLTQIALMVFGCVLALIVWNLGDVFGAMRFWFAIAVIDNILSYAMSFLLNYFWCDSV